MPAISIGASSDAICAMPMSEPIDAQDASAAAGATAIDSIRDMNSSIRIKLNICALRWIVNGANDERRD